MEKPIITVEQQYCLLCHALCLTHYLYLIVLLNHKNICDELSEAFDNTLSYLSVFYRWTFQHITIFFQQSRIPSATFLIHYFHTSHPLTSDSPAGDIIKKNTLVDFAYFILHINIKAITHTKQYNILPDNAAWIMTENCNIFLRKYIVSNKLIICLGLNYTDNIINNFLIMFNEFEN